MQTLGLQGNIRLRGPTSLFQAWLLETCQVARAETDLMVPWVSKKVLSDMRSGFGDFPPRNEDTYLVFIRKPNDPLFKERLSKSSSSWGTYQCTETVIFLGMLDPWPPKTNKKFGWNADVVADSVGVYNCWPVAEAPHCCFNRTVYIYILHANICVYIYI